MKTFWLHFFFILIADTTNGTFACKVNYYDYKEIYKGYYIALDVVIRDIHKSKKILFDNI